MNAIVSTVYIQSFHLIIVIHSNNNNYFQLSIIIYGYTIGIILQNNACDGDNNNNVIMINYCGPVKHYKCV